MPITGLGVELECPLAQLTDPGKDTGICQFSRLFSLAGLPRATASQVAMLGNHASRWLARTSHDVDLAVRFLLNVLLLALRHSRFPFETVIPASPIVCAVIRNIFRFGFHPFESVI